MKTTMQENRKRTYGSVGKKLFILLFSLGLAYGASAQRGGHGYVGGGFHGGYYGPHYYAPAYVGVGYGWGWGLGLGWGYPGWYGPWYAPYPPYYYGRGPMPPALNEEIDGIKSDYKAQIKDVKHDKALSHSDKSQKINQLEQQRDAAITQARHDFYNQQRRNYNNGQPQNNGDKNNNAQPGPGNSKSSNDPEHPEYSDKNATNGGQ
jgi:hypothetical protein